MKRLIVVAAALMAFGGAKAESGGNWPTNDLERLLVAAATNVGERGNFIRALLNGEVCAVTDKANGAPGKDGGYALLAMRAPDGKIAAPVFTSRQRAAELLGPDTAVVCGRGDKILKGLRGTRVILDPGQPYGMIWTAEELDHLLGVERVVTKQTTVELGVPAIEPTALITRLRQVFGAESQIEAAWLALAYWPETKEQAWYLDVRTSMERAQVNELLRNATTDVDFLGKPLDLVVNPNSANPGAGLVIVAPKVAPPAK
jgi:hypothetical protein